MRDISERRALEVDRQRAEADRNIFLAAISHDLRTPLNAIVGFTDLLARSELDTEQRHHVGLCRSASQTLLGLIDTVLELSRLEAGRVELRDERFNLPAFLTTQIGLLQPMAEEKGLSLIWSLEPDMPGWVRGDPVRFGQVLYNLVSNALKFTETGSIRVDGARSTCGRLMFTVADTGPGIPEADQGRIFDAFCQGGPVLARKEGSGLGLKICQELVRLMGGTIQLVSTPGVGTTFRFTVTLPSAEPDRAEAAAVPQEAVDTEAPVGQGLWVLVAEDDPTNALLFQKLLEQAGCHVTVVGNGREAVRHWQRASPDLVLMDLQMPEVDGREATRRIRAREAEDWLPRTPIALVTAHALDSFQQECFRIGCDAYLTKPLDRAELWQLLARVRAA
nr:ATP-binding protein [Halorhodospira halophila]